VEATCQVLVVGTVSDRLVHHHVLLDVLVPASLRCLHIPKGAGTPATLVLAEAGGDERKAQQYLGQARVQHKHLDEHWHVGHRWPERPKAASATPETLEQAQHQEHHGHGHVDRGGRDPVGRQGREDTPQGEATTDTLETRELVEEGGVEEGHHVQEASLQRAADHDEQI
jgi:hypothetical protein